MTSVEFVKLRKAELLVLGRAVSIVVETGNPARLARANAVKVVSGSLQEGTEGAISAVCESTTEPGTVYAVLIHPVDRGRIRKVSCSCHDHVRHNWACKHVLAVAKEFVNRGRREWSLLTQLEGVY